MLLRPRYLGRYQRIAEVLTRHGFGAIVAQLGLDRTLSLPRRILRREPLPASERTAARHVRRAMEELGPTFVKLGQILATRSDLLPPPYIVELSRLHDKVPPDPWEKIQPCIEAELGAPIEQLFRVFDPTPIASASLAQVYVALLPDGQEVVVKVQRPDIERPINADLDILNELARLAQKRTTFGEMYNLVELAEEFSAALLAELDYRREGRNADRFRNNFAKEPHLHIPRIYWDYNTRRVLVQERIAGIKIDDIAALDAAGYDRQQIAIHSAHFVIKEILEDGFFHADPHPGNLVIMPPGEVIGLMDFGTVGYLAASDRANLVRLFIMIIQSDAAGAVDQLVRMGIADPRLDKFALERDLRRVLFKYHGMSLKEVAVGEVLQEIEPIIYKHHLRVPGDLWLLIKTLVIMEGTGKKLSPDFDVFAVSEPYVKRFMLRLWLPSTWGPSVLRSMASLADLVIDLPRQTTRILNQVEQGDLRFRVDIPAVEQSTKQFNQIANRVILGILLAALIIALASLIPIMDLIWPWNLLTWIVVVSFVAMSLLAIWLIWSILRSNRRL